MKKNFILSCLAVTALLCACSRQDATVAGGQGSLSLILNFQEAAKASLSPEELLSTSIISIYKADFSGKVREYKYSELPAAIYLPADNYRVDVLAGEAAAASPSRASWDRKSYAGSSAFSISAGANSSVEVKASVLNVISKVTFDPSVAQNFADGYTFTIGTDASATLAYNAFKSGAEGYFLLDGEEGELAWTFSGTLASDGSSFSKSGKISSVAPGRMYSMTPKYTVRDGNVALELFVEYDTEVIDDMVVFEPVSTGLTPSAKYEIWAGHATVHADIDESEYSDPSKIKIACCAKGSAEWRSFDAVRDSEGVYSAVLTGLKGSTTYSYKLVIDGQDVGDPLSLTTEASTQLPNYDFETTSNAESDKWTSFYNPSSSDSRLKTKFWDSGSSASAGMMGAKYAICYSDSSVPAGIGSTKSARLQSMNVVVKFAAGNLFVGEFAGLDGMNGKVNFGRPWTTRPTAIRFWFKYKGGVVDNAGGGITKGEYDVCQLQVALGTWSPRTYGGSTDCPVQVNTANTSTFWKYGTLPETIAYANFEQRGNGSESAWKQVTVPFDYKSLTKYPTHILVSAAASKFGDYFAGSSDSAMWLDNLELVYE